MFILRPVGMNDVRVTDQLASEPRPSAKQAAMRVEIEQITVPSSKSKPGTAPKPSKGIHASHALLLRCCYMSLGSVDSFAD